MTSLAVRRLGSTWRAALAAITVTAVGSLGAGCGDQATAGGDDPASASRATLAMTWITEDQPQIAALLTEFQKANPSIKVNAQYVPVVNYIQLLRTQLLAGRAPDVFPTTPGTGTGVGTLDFARSKYIKPLTAPWRADLESFLAAQVAADDKVYGWPTYLSSGGLSFNMTLLRKLKLAIPTTQGELLDICARVSDAGYIPFAVQGGNPIGAFSLTSAILPSTGGASPEWFSKRASNSTTFSKAPEWQQAFTAVKDMQAAHCFQPGYQGATANSVTSLFAKGKTLMTAVGGTITPQALEAANPSQVVEGYPFPGKTADATAGNMGAGSAWSINAKLSGAKLAAAEKLINFAATKAVSNRYAKTKGGVSPYQVQKDQLELPDSLRSGFEPLLKADKVTPLAVTQFNGPDTYLAFANCSQGLLTGQATPQSCGQTMDAAWQKGVSQQR